MFPEVTTLAAALSSKQLTVAVAESCTAGLLGAALTAVPGSSAYMLGGVIAYADALKVRLLDVPEATLAAHGAVSDEVAHAMATGVRARTGADIGLSITGVAGPGVEEGGKPAGLIFVAAADAGGLEVVRLDGDDGREGNRVRAVHTALQLCLHCTERT